MDWEAGRKDYNRPERRMEMGNPMPKIPATMNPKRPRRGIPQREGPILARRIKDDPMIRAETKREKEIRLEARSLFSQVGSQLGLEVLPP
jgi:hypothetical protein